MKKIKQFFITALFGGITVILPVVLTLMVFNWLFKTINVVILPLTNILISRGIGSQYHADIIIIVLIVCLCFCVGLVERTRIGTFFINAFDKWLLKKIPGYTIIKETVIQFFGKNENPFASVAIVKLFGSETRATAFVTDRHDDGSYTVFIPTGPNPTSGQIYHLKEEDVQLVDYSIESTMKSIISCGAGSKAVLQNLK